MQRSKLFSALAIIALIALSSALALAQTETTKRGWGARYTLAGQGQPAETREADKAEQLSLAGGGILDVLEAQKEARRKALVGAWRINVAQSDTGLPPFNALHVFNAGGTFTEVSDLLPGLNETPAKGVWDVVGDQYLLTFELFVFDEQKHPAGIIRVRCSIRLLTPDEFTAEAVVDFIAPDSSIALAIDKSPFTGKRVKVMPLK